MNKMSQEIAISKCLKSHGDTCDYTDTIYESSSIKLKIRCTLHDITFYQLPHEHWRKDVSCPSCKKDRERKRGKVRESKYFKSCSDIHKGKYGYSLSKYKGSDKSISIICPSHGIFSTIAAGHLEGKGCKRCYIESRTDTISPLIVKRFKEEASTRFKGKFTYEYCGEGSLYDITCKKHDTTFKSNASQHLKVGHCPLCTKEKLKDSCKNKVKEVQEKLHIAYNGIYKIEESTYVKQKQKCSIFCEEHNNHFCASPYSLLRGYSLCRLCKKHGNLVDLVQVARNKPKKQIPSYTIDSFRESASLVQPFWDFSKAVYTRSHDYVTVTCEQGHIFTKTATKILAGDGCAECVNSRKVGIFNEKYLLRNPTIASLPYNLYHITLKERDGEEVFEKIGLTDNFKVRTRGFRGYEILEVISMEKGTLLSLFYKEQDILKKVKEKNKHYTPRNSFGGSTECFNIGALNEL